MKCIRVLHFSHIFFCIWPPGGSDMSKNWKTIIISSFLFIIYMHNELQSCSKSWNVSGYFISVILVSVFGHQGASICLNIGKKIEISPFLFIIYMHNELQTCGKSWNLSGVVFISVFGHQGTCGALSLRSVTRVHRMGCISAMLEPQRTKASAASISS